MRLFPLVVFVYFFSGRPAVIKIGANFLALKHFQEKNQSHSLMQIQYKHKNTKKHIKKKIKGLFEATTILHDEIHASV